MKIGMMNNPTKDLLEQIHWLGENGFDFLDWNLTGDNGQPAEPEAAKVKQALADHGLDVVMQAPHHISVASPLPLIRRAVRDQLIHYLDIAREVGSSLLSVHYSHPAPDFHVDQILDWHLDTLGPVCEQAEKIGVTITMENSSRGGKHQLLNMDTLMTRIPCLYVHLCSGHARLEDDYGRFDDYVRRLGARIRHVHLSENDGTADQHLPLGSASLSTIDWPRDIRRLRRTGYDGTITLKIFSPVRRYVLLSRDLLKQWWADAGPP